MAEYVAKRDRNRCPTHPGGPGVRLRKLPQGKQRK